MMKRGNQGLKEEDKMLSRRKMLTTMGIAGLTSISVPLSASKSNEPNGDPGDKNQVFLFFSNLEELKNDSSLKEGDIVKTAGYFNVGDGGGAEYLIGKGSDKSVEEYAVHLKNGLTASLVNVSSVNYQMFGAIGDGINDDGVQIKAAHAFANKSNVPVCNINGEFWIKDTHNIEIQTNAQWFQTIFHIDEKYNTGAPRFRVKSKYEPIKVELSDESKKSFLSQLKPGVGLIPELAQYSNCYMVVSDNKDRIGYRAGKAYGGRVSRMREELFYVEEHGRIIGDIAWEFSNYTSFNAYPVDENYLVIEGGSFHVSGDFPEKRSGYVSNGFNIERSRTIIRNQWLGLEKGKRDTSLLSRNGFYSFRTVYDCLLENVRLIPWEKDRLDKKTSVPQGTYGLGGSRMFNVVFRNITAEGSMVHWGVFGTNINKNFRIENCRLNRVDVHFHCWNLYIGNTEIGFKGISITGGGELFIENTRCRDRRFVNFRQDYGSKWDGNITIKNCRLAPDTTSNISILSFIPSNFDYKYPVGYAHRIIIENFIVDYSSAPLSEGVAWIIKTSALVSSKSGPLFFPYYLECKNISVEGRNKGLRLIEIRQPSLYAMKNKGLKDSVDLTPNSHLVFDNIHLERIENDDEAHITFDGTTEKVSEYSLLPKIKFKDCNDLRGNFGNNSAELIFENCSINSLHTGSKEGFGGSLSFNSCKFKPVAFSEKRFFTLSALLGTTFTNCILYVPILNGKSSPELFRFYDFVNINSVVKYNHLNTRLGNDILAYLRKENIKLDLVFISMLKSHHELEDERVK